MWGRRATREVASEDGAVAVEAALVTPLLLLLVFGMVEVAFLLRDASAVSSAARTGARIASASVEAGVGTCPTGPDAPPCVPATVPALAQAAADAVQQAGSAMPADAIERIWVYRANADGLPGAAASLAGASCVLDCVEFRWSPAAQRFSYTGGTWAWTSIDTCVNSVTSQSVGVYLEASRPMITGVFDWDVPLGERAVMKFEPLPVDRCAAGVRALP